MIHRVLWKILGLSRLCELVEPERSAGVVAWSFAALPLLYVTVSQAFEVVFRPR